jgi:biopolymer transport protein ExbB
MQMNSPKISTTGSFMAKPRPFTGPIHPTHHLRLAFTQFAVIVTLCFAAQAQTPPSVAAQTVPTVSSPAAMPSFAATPAVTPATPAIAATKTTVNNTANNAAGHAYGLGSVWREGDVVARLTLLVLAIMSLGSWYIIVAKLLEQRRMNRQAYAAHVAFAGVPSLRKAAEALAKDSVFRFIVDASLDALKKHDSVARQVDLNTWLAQDIVRSVGTVQMRTQSGMSVLATVGSTAPFVGLFGTVWGIYNALITIGISGQASIDKVAGPVGEALIMTALGLAVAVPAVLGYNWLVRRNRLAMHTMKGFSSDLHTLLLAKVEKAHQSAQNAPNAVPATEQHHGHQL